MVTRVDVVLKMQDVLRNTIDSGLDAPEYAEYRKLINTAAKTLVSYAFIKNAKNMTAEERSFMASTKVAPIKKILRVTMGGMAAMANEENKDGTEFRQQMDAQMVDFYLLLDMFFKDNPEILNQSKAVKKLSVRDELRALKGGLAGESDSGADTNIL